MESYSFFHFGSNTEDRNQAYYNSTNDLFTKHLYKNQTIL